MRAVTSSLIVLVLLVGLGVAGVGCGAEATTSIIEVRVTDAPSEYEVSSITVTVSEVKVLKTVAGQEEVGQGEWVSLGLTEANSFDLLEVAGDEKVLGLAEVATGDYTQISLAIEKIEITFKEEAPFVVPFVNPYDFFSNFKVSGGEKTILIFDFAVGEPVVVTVIEEGKTTIKYQPVGSINLSIRQERIEED